MKKLLSHIRILPDTKRILTRIVFAGALLLVVGAGVVLEGAEPARAATLTIPVEGCYKLPDYTLTSYTEFQCSGFAYGYTWRQVDDVVTVPDQDPEEQLSAFQTEVNKYECGFIIGEGTVIGCFLEGTYLLFFVVPSFLLFWAANFFNFLINLTIDSNTIDTEFVDRGWTITRDLSNIFFILILLYIGVKVILGLGGSEVKKMIARVVIMALLINFSMFFTKVVIDTSNILALIFYNRIDTGLVADSSGSIIGQNYPRSARGEKDVAGAMTAAFNPTTLIDESFFNSLKQIPLDGVPAAAGGANVPISFLFGMLIITGIIMGYAAYVFALAGALFLTRLITLWLLIIFSPFAFMSFTIPVLEKLKMIGWGEWSHKLIKTSFMASIFMFMLYFIFLLVQANPFPVLIQGSGFFEKFLLVVLPAFVLLYLLKYAASFAKEGAGKLGDIASTILKVGALGGTALIGGAAIGATAVAGRAVVGAGASRLAQSKMVGENLKKTGFAGSLARGTRRVADYGSKASFDLRGVKIAGKDISGVTGLKLGKAQEGGYVKAREEKVKKRMARAHQLEVREDEGLKQNLNALQNDLFKLKKDVEHEVAQVDKKIQSAREDASDLSSKARLDPNGFAIDPVTGGQTTNKTAAISAQNELERLKREKKAIREGTGAWSHVKVNNKSIKELETAAIPEAEAAIVRENRERKIGFVDNLMSTKINREAAHKIRSEVKIEDK